MFFAKGHLPLAGGKVCRGIITQRIIVASLRYVCGIGFVSGLAPKAVLRLPFIRNALWTTMLLLDAL